MMTISEQQENPDAVEVIYNLADFNAVILQRWRFWASMAIIIAGFIVGLPILFDLLDGYGLANAIENIEWLPPLILVLFLTALILASTALGYWWGKRKGQIVPTRFLVTEEGVAIENSLATSLLFWPTLKRVSTTGDRLFLFMTPQIAFVLPRRAFRNGDQFDRWVEIAKRRFAETRKAKSVTVE